MANSSGITKYKNSIISDLINNQEIVDAIDSEDSENLIYQNIFPYQYVPDLADKVITYITMTVDIPTVSKNAIWAYPRLTLYVISHQNHMKLDLPSISTTRNDYISGLIDEMLNGSDKYGYGRLELLSNIESSLNSTFKYRQLVFKTVDLNKGMCE